jgi:hypothetical protein
MARKPRSRARAATRPAVPPALLLAVFTAAIFVSAALLFAVQPMFTKIVLPRLGGSPSVWSVAMVFFQAVLLAGYAYAHFLMRHAPGRVAVIVHVLVLAAATLMLPLAIATTWGRPPADGEALWLLGLFTVSIGLPFFALSANAPLLQAWFARTGHPAAKDPYFLYAASNIGSFLALLSYPFLIEPFARLPDQTGYWSLVFYFLIVLIGACGVLLWRSPGRLPRETDAVSGRVLAPSWQDAATWVALAAIPSGLLVAVTAYVSTDVAAIPLLWVIPLALYLATFVIVFARKPLIRHEHAVMIAPAPVIALIVIQIFDALDYILLTVTINAAAFFFLALVCHGELAKRRPLARYLTSFYLWMSAGGMIGGISAGLIAPHVFSWIAEYPILIALALLCRPGLRFATDRNAIVFWIVFAVAALGSMVPRLVFGWEPEVRYYTWFLCILLALGVLVWRDPLKFAVLIALCFVTIRIYEVYGVSQFSLRSFFGVHRIYETNSGQFRVLKHGTTVHGAQQLTDDDGKLITGRPPDIMYYYESSAMAQAVRAAREVKRGPIKMAVIGLGAGALACHTRPRETVTYYEIDPSVIRIATDNEWFTYLSKCAPNAQLVLGDARLTLADAPDGQYDIILVDAFSSDAIPIHLLTREAMAVYLKRLSPRGLVVMHVSNRHLELASVVGGIARANGMVAMVNRGDSDQEADSSDYKFVGTVTAAARVNADFGTLPRNKDWQALNPDPRQWVWTDDYSNVIGSMLRQLSR